MAPAEREAFLAAMPEDVRNELLAAEAEETQADLQESTAAMNQEKLAFYAALPPEIRDQVMAEEARQERALQEREATPQW